MKKLLFKRHNNQVHWVGDGFPVRTIFSYTDFAKEISPFLMMDYAAPVDFAASSASHQKGVGEHPHRGFETVTLVFSGEIEHRDSAGGGGKIGPGDVQWMTAASGLVHEEKHGKEFSKTGGRFEMVQLWVNLPAKDKLTKPRYQGLKNEEIPRLALSNDGSLRIIAGAYRDRHGPALTHTPINLWDVTLKAGSSEIFNLKPGHTAAFFVMSGNVKLGTGESIADSTLAVLEAEGDTFTINAEADTQLIILSGEPILEPIVGYGPFVMNTRAEIQQALVDFQDGKMGKAAAIAGSD